MTPRIAPLLALIALTLIRARLGAQDPPALSVEDLAETWRWRSFDYDESLSAAGTIFSLGHDRDDDTIFAGTESGVFRYNGYVWTRRSPRLGAEPTDSVVQSGDEVWVTTASGVWIADSEPDLIYRSARFHVAPALDGLYILDLENDRHVRLEGVETKEIEAAGRRLPRDVDVHDYVVDSQSIHWAATSSGLYRRDVLSRRNHWQRYYVPGISELRSRPCRRLFLVKHQDIQSPRRRGYNPRPDAVGYRLWALFEGESGNVLLRRDTSGKWHPVALPAQVSPDVDIESVTRDGLGNYYATTAADGLLFSAGGERWEIVRKFGVEHVRLRSGLLDLHGYVWFAGEHSNRRGGVVRFDPESAQWTKLRPTVGPIEGTVDGVLSLLQASDGTIWIGTWSDLFRFENGALYRETEGGRSLKAITGIAEDEQGRVWICSERSFVGVRYFDGSWWGVRHESTTKYHKIVTDRQGELWFLPTTGRRLFRYRRFINRDEETDFVVPPGPIGDSGRISDMVEDQSGAFWVATGSGLLKLELEAAGEVASFRTVREFTADSSPALEAPGIFALTEDPADGSIWICYLSSGFGVSRITPDGAIEHFERDGNIYSITATPPGKTDFERQSSNIWLGTSHGVSRFDGECWYDYPVASLGRQSEVFPIAPGNDRSLLVGTSGFGPRHGVYWLRRQDFRKPRFVSTEPSLRRTSRGVVIRWDARDVKDVTPPDRLQFRCRIDGGPWLPFTTRREIELPIDEPGIYEIESQVRDLEGNAWEPLPTTQKVGGFASLPWLIVGGSTLAALLIALFALRLGRRAVDPLARYRGVFRALDAPVLVIDSEARIVEFNGRRPELVGMDRLGGRRARGLPIHLVPAFQASPELRRVTADALAGGAGACVAAVSLGGASRALGLRAVPVRRESADRVRGAVLFVHDETNAQRARATDEERVRMSAVREFAEKIFGELELQSDGPHRDDSLAEALELFSGSIRRLEREEIAPVELLEALVASPNGAVPLVPDSVRVDVRGQPGLWRVSADRRWITRVFEEVLKNAGDALPRGGAITVRMANRSISPDGSSDAPIAPELSGRYVEITIEDNGPGIGAHERSRVFDPLYSTKPRHRHRGIGLSVAYGIVRSHRGEIRVDESSERGARVTILLPAAGGD